MDAKKTATNQELVDVALRIREMREVMGFSPEDMAEKTEVTVEQYLAYESATEDLPFTFVHKCALAFDIELMELLEGHSARLSTYNVTRAGHGHQTAKEEGISIVNMAPRFKNKLAEPYWVTYDYSKEQQKQPIHLTTHDGHEFDYIIKGSLIVQVGANKEVLHEGDTIYYNSATPHGMIATDGAACTFLAVVIPDEKGKEEDARETIVAAHNSEHLLAEKFVKVTENELGGPEKVEFKHADRYNFGFDTVDAIANKYPEKLAMIHLDGNKTERRFTYKDIKKESNRVANYFRSLGIQKGDKVMLVLKRHYQFWFCMVALHKLGAIAIPASCQLKQHDFEYRFDAASVKAIICTADGDTADLVDAAVAKVGNVTEKFLVNGLGEPVEKDGWHDFNSEYTMFSSVYARPKEDAPQGDEPALMFFSSGTSGNPKMVLHKHTYGLGHFLTARYWHCCEPDGLHFTISDTGWGKSAWGKLYGQWLCEGTVFTYDFDRFDAADIMPMFQKYQITTFCAPPTMLRLMVKQDLSQYDFSSVKYMTTAGEALNPETAKEFKKMTGLKIREGFGQTETTLTIANFVGVPLKMGSMGKASPQYHIDVVDPDDQPVSLGKTGEIVIRLDEGTPLGLFKEYYRDEDMTENCMRNGMYHTGDTAWRDEDGYFWYVGRVDDIIKSSGYRIGPFEIESVIMELPYVLECGVSAAPDEVRGQIVKASIVLTPGTEGTEELKKEIQQYVKEHTAPYKYPRLVVFRDELPKTTNGKIQRSKL